MLKKLTLTFLSLIMFGCASAIGPDFKETSLNEGQSLIYVYRTWTFAGSGNLLWINKLHVNGEMLGKMKVGGYYSVVLAPGSHNVSVVTKNKTSIGEIDFDINAGEIRYFEYSETISDFKKYGSTIVTNSNGYFFEVPEKIAKERISGANLLEVES